MEIKVSYKEIFMRNSFCSYLPCCYHFATWVKSEAEYIISVVQVMLLFSCVVIQHHTHCCHRVDNRTIRQYVSIV